MITDSRIKKLEEPILAKLPARERVKMILDAGAKREAETVRRLMETCPRAVYNMKAADFMDQMDGARRVATVGVGIWEQARAGLELVKAMTEVDEEIFKDPEMDRENAKIARAALLNTQRRFILTGFQAVWAGLDTLSREVCGVSGLELLSGLPLEGGWRLPEDFLSGLEAAIGEAIPDQAEEDLRHREKLADYWTETLRKAYNGAEAA